MSSQRDIITDRITRKVAADMSERDTPGPLVALTEMTKVKTNVATIISVICFAIGAAIWGTVVYGDVQTLKKSDSERAAQIKEMSETLGSLRDEVRQLRWTIDPPISHAVVSQGRTLTGALK